MLNLINPNPFDCPVLISFLTWIIYSVYLHMRVFIARCQTCAINTSPNGSKYVLSSCSVVFHGRPSTMRSEHLLLSCRLFLLDSAPAPASSPDLLLSTASRSPALGVTQTNTRLDQPVSTGWKSLPSASLTPRQARDSGLRNLRPQARGNWAERVESST